MVSFSRRSCIASLALGASGLLRAQVPSRRFRVTVARRRSDEWARMFAQHGLVVGSDLDLGFVPLDFADEARAREKARAIVQGRPDAILVPGGTGPFVLKSFTHDIPIVFFNFGGDPVRLGLVESLARPGGNITGTTNRSIEAIGKAWELMRALLPSARKGGCLVEESYLGNAWMPLIRESQQGAAARLGLKFAELVIPRASPIEAVTGLIERAGVEMLDVLGGWRWPWLDVLMRYLVRARILAHWEVVAHVRKGGLISVIGDGEHAVRDAVGLVARILRGEKPAELPILESRRILVALNLKTAGAMGLEIPPAVRLRADVLVE